MVESEWPPSSIVMWVFSSLNGQCEEKALVRQGPPAGTIAQLTPFQWYDACHAVYWRGALYVQREHHFAIRYVATYTLVDYHHYFWTVVSPSVAYITRLQMICFRAGYRYWIAHTW
jgi:hypothetical protein